MKLPPFLTMILYFIPPGISYLLFPKANECLGYAFYGIAAWIFGLGFILGFRIAYRFAGSHHYGGRLFSLFFGLFWFALGWFTLNFAPEAWPEISR